MQLLVSSRFLSAVAANQEVADPAWFCGLFAAAARTGLAVRTDFVCSNRMAGPIDRSLFEALAGHVALDEPLCLSRSDLVRDLDVFIVHLPTVGDLPPDADPFSCVGQLFRRNVHQAPCPGRSDALWVPERGKGFAEVDCRENMSTVKGLLDEVDAEFNGI